MAGAIEVGGHMRVFLILTVFAVLIGIATWHPPESSVEPVECRFVPAPITKNLVVKEPDKIICPVTRGRN
jgi:hypothetical protein